MAFGLTRIGSLSDDTDVTSPFQYTMTTTRALAGNALGLVSFVVTGATEPTIDAVTGQGLTWVEVGSILISTRKLFVYRSMGASPSTGNIVVDLAAAASAINAHYFEITGVDTSGTNGSGAVGTPGTNGSSTLVSGNTLTATLAAFADANNLTFVAAGGQDEVSNFAFEAGYTEDYDSRGLASALGIGYKPSEDTSVVVTYTGPGTFIGMLLAVEIKAPAAAGGFQAAWARGANTVLGAGAVR